MISINHLRIPIIVMALVNLGGCLSGVKEPSEAAKQVHIGVVRETAISYGTQYALHWEANYVNDHLDKHARELDTVYDFRQLLLDNSVIPPILEESRQNVTAGDPRQIRVSDRLIRIVKPAVFSTVSPSWRDYVYMRFPLPDAPNEKLLPRNKEERKAWDAGLIEGWNVGRWQAKSIFYSNIGMLQRDFTGMVLYHSLLAQNMISPTHSSIANLGVTGDGQSMQLNDRVVKITTESTLQPNQVDQWNAAVQKLQSRSGNFK